MKNNMKMIMEGKERFFEEMVGRVVVNEWGYMKRREVMVCGYRVRGDGVRVRDKMREEGWMMS